MNGPELRNGRRQETLDCEVLVIGSGPGGSVTAHALAAAGHDVLVVEEGPDTSGLSCPPYSSQEMNLKYRNAGLTPFIGSARSTYAEGRCLGGGSEVNSGFFHRIADQVLDEWRRQLGLGDLDISGLERFYKDIERRLRVGCVSDGEGAASRKVKHGADSLGWVSEEVPRWITSDKDAQGRWQSQRHGMSSTYLLDARAHGCRIESGIVVDRLIFKGTTALSARARQIDGYQTLHGLTIRFRWAFVCGGATGTAALLRRSGITQNVGNTLRIHPMVRVVARFDDTVNEGDFGVPVRQILHFKPELTLGCSVSAPPHLALWMAGRDENVSVGKDAPRLAVFYALVRSATCGRIRNVPFLPEPLVFWNPAAADHRNLADGLRKLAELLFAAGARQIFLPMPGCPPVSNLADIDSSLRKMSTLKLEISAIHMFGACPLGNDAARYPLDPYGKIVHTANLFVNDTSMLPTTTGVNPQATIMAIAMRNAQHFLTKNRQAP